MIIGQLQTTSEAKFIMGMAVIQLMYFSNGTLSIIQDHPLQTQNYAMYIQLELLRNVFFLTILTQHSVLGKLQLYQLRSFAQMHLHRPPIANHLTI
jgi:hypothetical protein